METKRCKRCGFECDLLDASKWFSRHSGHRDKLRTNCKRCCKEEKKIWHAEHPGYSARYYHEHADEQREKDRARTKSKRANDPYYFVAKGLRRRARDRGLPAIWTKKDWLRAIEYFHGCCAICGRAPGLWHKIVSDHWIPLVSPDCPGSVPTNIIPLCHGIDGCNNIKGDTAPQEWLIKRYGARKGKRKLAEIQAYFDLLR